MNKLSNRLKEIASLVPLNSYVADVGADHGKLGIYLLKSNISYRVQSIENKVGPFLGMKENFKDANLLSKVDLCMSDGIKDLKPDVKTVVIAGMGGLLTVKILKSNLNKLSNISTIIVDPHRDVYEVRRYLADICYAIVDERLIYEDKTYYTIIKACKVDYKVKYDENELLFGPILIKNKSERFQYYLEDQLRDIDGLLSKDLSENQKNKYLNLKERITSLL